MSKAIKAIEAIVAMTLLFVVENVRGPLGLKIAELCADISANGLTDPIVVVERGDKNEICQGHRRVMALEMLKATDPERYEELFGDGIPCKVWSGLSDAEVLVLKLDDGNALPLRNVFEAYLSTKFHFQAGTKEGDIAVSLAGLYDRTHRPKARIVKKLDELNGQLAKETDPNKKDEIVKQIRKEVLDYRKGLIQGFKNIYDCPKIVERAHYYKNFGQKVVGKESEKLPKGITAKQTAGLKKAHLEDLETVGSSASKEIPGPIFWAKWTEVCTEDDKKNDGEKAPRAKAMSASDMQDELKNGKYSSQLAQMLTRRHAGQDVNGSDLLAHDRNAFIFDLVIAQGDSKATKAVQTILDAGDKLIEVLAAKAQKEAEQAAKDAEKKEATAAA